MKKIILASVSERRSQILTSCGVKHVVIGSNIEELKSGSVSEVVRVNAEKKAEKAVQDSGEAVIIGADTLVAHGEDIIGKPQDENAAKDLLKRFSGSDIEVYTGLCVIDTSSGKKASGVDMSEITVVSMTEEKIENYFKLLAPYDKAGGFSIEGVGSLLFDNIKGSYFNILGLPMIKLNELFKEIGLNLLEFLA